MKSLFLVLFSFIATLTYSQKKEVLTFKFDDINIEYTRLDYSNYGITQYFITMHEDNTYLNAIEKKSINCLKKRVRLYHTLYFFLKIPPIIKSTTERKRLFSQFIKHLELQEKQNNVNLYLNFDLDYSGDYISEHDNVKRIITGIYPKKICKVLSIR